MGARGSESFDPAPAGTRGRGAHPPKPPRGARDAAHRVLAAQARRFPDLLPAAPDGAGLDDRDAALAHAIYDAAVRRWLTLAAILESRLSRPLEELEPRLRAVLLAGAAQLLFLDRLPDHAVIHESVEWAKGAIRPGAGAMVNAVLRRVAGLRAGHRGAWGGERDEIPLEDGRALALAEPVLPEEPAARLAAATSHPPELIRKWVDRFGAERARRIALHDLVRAPTILNTRHAAGALPASLRAHGDDGHHVFEGSRAELIDLVSARTDLWVQDAASAAAVWGVRELRPRVIADMCAGQGTKTRQLAAVFPDAEIIATDSDERRLAVLRGAMASRPRVRIAGLAEARRALIGRADLVLLDVPCSNTGVLARRVEARYRAGGAMSRILGVQRQIIADAIPLLAPRGAILYSTCSLEREENEGQAEWARKWHGFKIERAATILPRGGPGDDARDYSDGAFSCVLGAGERREGARVPG